MVSERMRHKSCWSCCVTANAAPVVPVDQHKYPVKVSQDFLYQQAVTQLKNTQIWKRSEAVRNWLNTTWLSIPQVCMHATQWQLYYYICLTLQRWARAYRDGNYHAYVNTNNGVEAQNRLLKYSYLPKRKHLSLSAVTRLISFYLICTGNTFLPTSGCHTTIAHTKILCPSSCMVDHTQLFSTAWSESVAARSTQEKT